MSSINRWLTSADSLRNRERLLSILYTLGMATKEQLSVVTGWQENKVRDRIKELRDQVPIPEHLRIQQKLLADAQIGQDITEQDYQKLAAKVAKQESRIERGRNEWVTIVRRGKKDSFYTLGTKGNNLAKEIRREYVKKNANDPPKTQTDHFYGTNEILCRLRRKGILEDDWLSGGEVQQDLHYFWNRHHRGKGIPYRPDAYLELDPLRCYLEFDTGSERNGQLRRRFANCLRLYNSIKDPKRDRLPDFIIWVCGDEHRKKSIERIAQQILQDYLDDHAEEMAKLDPAERFTPRIPTCYCFVAGEDTRFFLGEIEGIPFWYGQ